MNQSSVFRQILGKLKAENLGVSGEKPLVGWVCTYLPLEIIEAAGLSPHRIIPEASSESADTYLDPNFCPFIKASLGKALEGGYSSLSGMVILNTCDGMRRLYDAWRFYVRPPFAYLLDVPRMVNRSSIAFFADGLKEMILQIEKHFGTRVSEEKLISAIEEANITRSLVKRLFSSQGLGDPALRQSDIIDILSEGWSHPRGVFNKALGGFLDHLGNRRAPNRKGPRLMVTGSLLNGSHLIQLIEELGGEVITCDLCTGERFVQNVNINSEPLMALSKAYLEKPPCARMFDIETRVSYLKEELGENKVDGVIYFALKFCDPYLYEKPAVEEMLDQLEVPLLFLEGEFTSKSSGSMRTRIQAFLEVIRNHGG